MVFHVLHDSLINAASMPLVVPADHRCQCCYALTPIDIAAYSPQLFAKQSDASISFESAICSEPHSGSPRGGRFFAPNGGSLVMVFACAFSTARRRLFP